MNITVLGANGKTGLQIVNQALAAGHAVTGLVRHNDALQMQPGLTIVVGDATNAEDVAKASQGADVIISALGAMGGTLLTDSVNAVITAHKTTGVNRFILMSSFAVKKDRLSGGLKLLTGLAMGKAIKDKATSEDLLKSSELAWTIVYPTTLTNAPQGGIVRVVQDTDRLTMKNKIARADVAAWIVAEAEKEAFLKKEIMITSS